MNENREQKGGKSCGNSAGFCSMEDVLTEDDVHLRTQVFLWGLEPR